MAEQNLFPNTDGTKVTGVTVTRSLGGGTPTNIYDGDTGTNDLMATWHNYWTIDLGSIKNICKYRIYPVDNTANIIIYASDTGAFAGEEYYLDYLSTGGAGASQRGITLGAWNDFYINPKIQARYIRIWTENNNVKLAEFEVYEDTVTPFGSLSSDDTDYDGAINTIEEFRRRSITDNVTSINPPGSSQYFNVGKYFQVDLGSQKSISKIGTYVNNACQYSVKVSTTGAFGGEEVTVVNNASRSAGQYNDTTNLPYTCRYIRVIASGSNTQLTEVTVYELQKTTYQKTINSDSHFKQMDVQKTINADVKFVTSREIKTIDSDVHFKSIDVNKSIDSDIHFKQLNIQKTINSDVVFSNSVRKTIDSDVHFKQKIQKIINSDIHFKKLDNQQTINSNISFKTVDIQKTIDSDITFKSRVQKPIDSNIIFRGWVDFVGRIRIISESLKDFYGRLKIVQTTPNTPTNLIGEDVGNGESVYLHWDDVSNYGYNVYLKVGLSWIKQNTDVVLNTSFTVGSLTELTPYTFMVRGCNGAGDESSNSNEVIVTPTLVKDKSASYKVFINGIHRTDAILKQVELVYGPSFSTTVFELLKPVASAPIAGDEVIVTIRDRRVFLGTIVIIDDVLEETLQSITYTAVNKLWELTHSTVGRDFNTQEDQEAGIIYNTIGMLSISGLPITGAPIIWPGGVSIKDQNKLDAMVTIIGYCGNYKIHCDAYGNVQYYHFGTGPNRILEDGKQILARNIRTDITDQINRVSIYRESSSKIIKQFIISTDELIASPRRKGYYFVGSCSGYRVSDITVEVLKKPLPEITYAEGIEILPGHCNKDKWEDGSTESKAPVHSVDNYSAEWTGCNAEVEYSNRDLAYVYIPAGTQLANERLMTTNYSAKFYDADGTATTELVEIADRHFWEGTLLRVMYTIESITTEASTVGSGSKSRSYHDNNFDINLSSKATVEFDKYSKPTIGGEMLVLGDETLNLMSKVNGYDIQRIIHDFSTGFTTRISLTNEPYYQGLNSFSKLIEKEKTKENVKDTRNYSRNIYLSLNRIKYLSGLSGEPKNKTVPEKEKGSAHYSD